MNSAWVKARAGRLSALLVLGLMMISAGAAFAATDSTLKIDLWNKNDGSQGITISPAEIKAGKVTFDVTNSSTNEEHELMYVKTDLAPDQLPMLEDSAKVNEGKLTGFHEFGDIPTGESENWTAELTPGRYIVFCNEEGHYGAGMHSILTVTP